MKIGVCFKSVPDYGLLGPSDYELSKGQAPDLEFVRKEFNGFEESALELALRLADHQRERHNDVSLTALTIDNSKADIFLRQLYAVGYDQGVRIEPDNNVDLRFTPLLLSSIIHKYSTCVGKFDALIFGEQGGIGDNGQTGFFVAERLGWPCISNVTDVKPGPDSNKLAIQTVQQGRTIVQTVALPVVIIVSNTASAPFLRVPTLPQKLAAAKKQIDTVSMDSFLGLDNGKDPREKKIVGLQRLVPKRRCVMIEGQTCKEKAQFVYDTIIKQTMNP